MRQARVDAGTNLKTWQQGVWHAGDRNLNLEWQEQPAVDTADRTQEGGPSRKGQDNARNDKS